MRSRAVSCVVIAGLSGASPACGYQPGSFTSSPRSFQGQRVTEGCLDLAVHRRPDRVIGPAVGPVLAFAFGNRCDRPAVVDLATVAVLGRTRDGGEVALRPYDPRAELAALWLDGRSTGGEAIAYPTARAISEICVDTASLARVRPARWVCLASKAAPVVGRAP